VRCRAGCEYQEDKIFGMMASNVLFVNKVLKRSDDGKKCRFTDGVAAQCCRVILDAPARQILLH
jgi:hypothetical protein